MTRTLLFRPITRLALVGGLALALSGLALIHGQILHMADMLSDGIVAQFPGQFSR